MGPDVSTGSLYLVQRDRTFRMNGLRIVLIRVSNFAVFSTLSNAFLLSLSTSLLLLLLFAVAVVVVVVLLLSP